MTQYKKFLDNQTLSSESKRRPGQSGCDGNKELRTKVVQFTLSNSEYLNLVEQFMKSPCSTMAVYCREKSLSKETKVANKNKLKTEMVAEFYQVCKATDISQTGKMGNNLSQIARKLHSNEGFNNFKNKMLDELRLMREMNKKLDATLLKITGGDL